MVILPEATDSVKSQLKFIHFPFQTLKRYFSALIGNMENSENTKTLLNDQWTAKGFNKPNLRMEYRAIANKVQPGKWQKQI